MNYRERALASEFRAAIRSFPVVVLTGARQVGKSTFLQQEFPDFSYLTLDDYAVLDQAEKDPASLWAGKDKVIIDEAQRSPGLFLAVKLAVDGSGRSMRVILSGSSNLLLMERISETLAGRAVYFTMLPMGYGEMTGRPERAECFENLWVEDCRVKEETLPVVDPLPLLVRGFMPPLLELFSDRDVLRWWEGYVATYLERDLRELSQVDSLIDFRRVLEAVALRSGQLLNQTGVARDTGVSQPTVHRYLKLLEVSHLIERVPAYHASRTRRTTKSPKALFAAPALAVYLSGYHDEKSLREAREKGSFFENLVFLHLKILAGLMTPKGKIFYWRTTTGKEVDFVIEHGRSLLAIEAKLTEKPTARHIDGLLEFMKDHPSTVRGILVHAGAEVKWLHSRVLALPWYGMGWERAGGRR